ncbi:MAG: FliA/WhiG family RNA polymerase sigma factor [Nitrospirae bacterium]|nr:FliA/WhiG family RNA polymerase sigma factor [Nitrospirota bacterium]
MEKTAHKVDKYKAKSKSAGKGIIDPQVRDRLIQEYGPKIKYMAYRLSYRLQPDIDIDDLISAGIIGLMDAMDKYDPSKETLFKTYAEFRIRGAMLDEIRAMDWVPRSVKEKAGLLYKTVVSLEKRLGRPPTAEEIAGELKMSITDYQNFVAQAHSSAMISIEDLGVNLDNDRDLLEVISDPGKRDPLTLLLTKDTKKTLTSAIDNLPEKERKVVALYYYNELTMKEIGQILEVTESRISQLHTQAMFRLKGKLQEKNG